MPPEKFRGASLMREVRISTAESSSLARSVICPALREPAAMIFSAMLPAAE